MQRQPWQKRRQTLFQTPERHTLAVGMKRTDDGQTRLRGLDRIVMAHLAGDVELGLLRDRIVEQISASAGADRGPGDFSAFRPRNQEVIQFQAALEPTVEMPGLADAQSQLAIPLVVKDRLVGVLGVESATANAFDELDEMLLSIVGL